MSTNNENEEVITVEESRRYWRHHWRRVFAGRAMQGMISAHTGEMGLPNPEDAAEDALCYADALLDEIDKREDEEEKANGKRV